MTTSTPISAIISSSLETRGWDGLHQVTSVSYSNKMTLHLTPRRPISSQHSNLASSPYELHDAQLVPRRRADLLRRRSRHGLRGMWFVSTNSYPRLSHCLEAGHPWHWRLVQRHRVLRRRCSKARHRRTVVIVDDCWGLMGLNKCLAQCIEVSSGITLRWTQSQRFGTRHAEHKHHVRREHIKFERYAIADGPQPHMHEVRDQKRL